MGYSDSLVTQILSCKDAYFDPNCRKIGRQQMHNSSVCIPSLLCSLLFHMCFPSISVWEKSAWDTKAVFWRAAVKLLTNIQKAVLETAGHCCNSMFPCDQQTICCPEILQQWICYSVPTPEREPEFPSPAALGLSLSLSHLALPLQGRTGLCQRHQ